jgi:CRISPR/Cas system-associated protein Cas10 (large subunit of type III CRISPR-Cas system)
MSSNEWSSAIRDASRELASKDKNNRGQILLMGLLGSSLLNFLSGNKNGNKNEKEESENEESESEKSKNKRECSICLEPADIKIALPCGHTSFHKKCIANVINMKCPICRKPFTKVIDLYV